jgi:two-component system response regulator RpfG
MAFTAALFSLERDGFQYKATIIIIDVQMIFREILCQIVSSINGNHDVRDFASPKEALEWTKHHPVDLVLTDYKMPRMNGVEFIRIFRTHPACADVPVIMVTSEGEPLVRLEALEAGVTEFMVKPVDHNECREFCRNLLTQYQQ